MASFSGAGSGVLLSTLSINSFSLHPVDILILGVFLVATLIVGLSYGQQVKNIKDYALGGKNFSTYTLVATIVATDASGGGLYRDVENTYTNGLYFIIALAGYPLGLWLTGQLALRMEEFMEHVSIAEAIGSVYGRTVQVITACSSILAKVGFIAVQFQAISKILQVLFDLDGRSATAVAAIIVIIYSSLGGIKSVTFTDVLQFITFGIVIPTLAISIWSNVGGVSSKVVAQLASNPNFDIRQVVGWNKEFFSAIGLLLYFAVPGFSPSTFQRIVMSKNIHQAKRSFTYAAFVLSFILIVTVWISILLLSDNPSLDKKQIIPYMIDRHTYLGLKGLLGAGIMALAMSTADSLLNSLSVIFANDLVKPLTRKSYDSVVVARLFSVVGGLIALLLALYNSDILSLILLSGSLFMPVFTVPMLMTVLGFRTSSRGVIAGMATGLTTVIVWSSFYNNGDSIIPGMLANLLMLLSSHYLWGEPGGWKKVDPHSLLGRDRARQKEVRQRRIKAIKNFSIYQYLRSNLPQQEGVFTFFGLYAMAATYTSFYTLDSEHIMAYRSCYRAMAPMVLSITATFLSFPVWGSIKHNKRLITFLWPIGIAILLFFSGTFLMLMSHFQPLQLMVLVFNTLVAVLLLQGVLVLLLALSGIGLASLAFTFYTGLPIQWDSSGISQFGGFYILVLLSCILIALFRYQNGYQELGKKNEALKHRDKDQQANLIQAAAEKQAALASFQHTGAEQLLSITRELQTMHVAEEDQERMKALQTELLPIAFHLQGLDTRARDYLRLNKVDFAISAWCEQIKEEAVQKGNMLKIHCRNDSQIEELNGDTGRLTTLLVKSIMALSTSIESQDLEDQPTIFFRIEDTQLSYPLPDVKPGYIKYIPAVRLAMTVGDDLPLVRDSYDPDLTGRSESTTAEALANFDDTRLIKAHYGYAEVMSDTFIYVVPVDVEDVRPKDMDKDYMEVGAKPKRADDHFKNDEGIDAQAQEAAFLADVAARSDADLGMVQMALETIKWYHGPKGRNSGEPFYLHPLTVAHIVLDYNTDEETILGALLHDTVEDTAMQLEHIEAMFGKEAAKVVDVVTHLQSIEGSIYKIKMSALENLQMLDRTDRTKGLYVKIADRMHNMRTIGGHKKVAKRKLVAQETADFFVPLARKLGLEKAAAEFEKMCTEVFKQKE